MSSDDLRLHGPGDQAGQPGQNAGKKQRTSFSGWQIYELEKLFAETKYIGTEERRLLSR